jgi:hypothetical protein
VWFSVAGGMLSDVYSPASDNTNVETMQGGRDLALYVGSTRA